VIEMPLIVLWNETVAGSERQILRWLRSMERSNVSQCWWLRNQVRAAEEAETRSRGYPVFRFYNGALTARVSPAQFAALLDVPVPSFGHHVVEGAKEWNIVRDVNDSVVSTSLLPELITTLADVVGGLRRSVAQFDTPSRGMFDLDRLDASALPGLAALTFRTLGQDREALKGRAEQIHGAMQPGDTASPSRAAPESSAPLVVRLDAIGGSLDDLTRLTVAGMLVIPTLVVLVPRLGGDAQLSLRHWFIDLAEGIETSAYVLRQDILTTFAIDLPVAVERSFVFVDAVRTYVLDSITFGGLLGVEVLRGAFGGMSMFAGQLMTVWDQFVVVLQSVLTTGQAIVDLDIGEPVHRALVAIDTAIGAINPLLRRDPYDAPDQFPVTVGELVLNTGAGARAQRELQAGVRGLRKAWSNLAFEDAQEWLIEKLSGYSPPTMIRALARLVDALGHPQHVPPAVANVRFDGSDLDDLGARIVTPLRRGADALLDRFEQEATFAVQGIGTAAHEALTDVARTFHAASVQATRVRSLRLIEGVVGDTDKFLDSTFGTQRASVGDDRFDALAGQYSAWLVQGGFEAIGAVLAGYVGAMIDQWTGELGANADTPFDVTESSPRKLLKRARLGSVHTPRIRIAVRADELGQPLAGRIADTFQTAISDAYRAGEARLQEAATAVAV